MAITAATHARAFFPPVEVSIFDSSPVEIDNITRPTIITPTERIQVCTVIDSSLAMSMNDFRYRPQRDIITGASISGVHTASGFVGLSGDTSHPILQTTIGERATTSAVDRIRFQISQSTGASSENIYINSNDIQISVEPVIESNGPVSYRLTYTTGYGWAKNEDAQVSLKNLAREFIKSNLVIKMAARKNSVQSNVSPQELKARDTLRDMITEREWRRYVTNGFIMVKGASDFVPIFAKTESARGMSGPFWYQIFWNKRVAVFQNNTKIGEICIHSDQACPPTDHVINIKVLAELDEHAIWKDGNWNRSSDNIRYSRKSSIAVGERLVDRWKNRNMAIYSSSEDMNLALGA